MSKKKKKKKKPNNPKDTTLFQALSLSLSNILILEQSHVPINNSPWNVKC